MTSAVPPSPAAALSPVPSRAGAAAPSPAAVSLGDPAGSPGVAVLAVALGALGMAAVFLLARELPGVPSPVAFGLGLATAAFGQARGARQAVPPAHVGGPYAAAIVHRLTAPDGA